MFAGVLSVVAAAFYTVGLALQQQANLDRPADPAAGRVATVWRIVTHPRWLGGFALTVVGFGLHGTALALGSLTVVQILQTSQIIFVVPLSARVAGVSVQRRDWAGAAMVAVGLVALLLAVRPSEDEGAGSPDGWLVAVAVVAVTVAALLVAATARPGLRAPLLGLAAGLVFGVEGATLKVAADDLAEGLTIGRLVGIAVWATLALAVTGVVIQNMALRAGRLSVALSTMTIATPIASTVLGVALFGENLEVSVLTVAVAAAAAALGAFGVVLLSQATALTVNDEPEALDVM